MPARLLATAMAALALMSWPHGQSPASSQTVPSFDFVLGEGRTVESVPATQWLKDGTLLLLDSRPAPASRTFEVLDPATGSRRAAFDMAKAVASLNALRPATPVQTLAWPAAIDTAGRRALYNFDADLFLLTLGTSSFARLTSTTAEETSPEFSPDGRLLVFVRRNDLYVVN